MNIKKKFLLVFLLLGMFVIFCKNSVYAGYQEWNALDYEVTINEDGSIDIIETWDVYISGTNTVFKDFDLSDDNYRIKNVKISRVDGEKEKELTQIFEEQYHVDSDCYYGLLINDETFEIAWNVGLDNSSDNRKYKMYYTVENAIKTYNDCSELYWQFLSNENTMTGKNITGTIRLPKEINDIERFRVWAHGDYTGEIRKVSNSVAKFSLNQILSNEMLEVRIVTEENICPYSRNLYNENKLNEILAEENRWAAYANFEREFAKNKLRNVFLLILVFIIFNLLILQLFLIKKKYIRKLEKN